MPDPNSEGLGLSWDETLFCDEGVFEVGYVPEAIHHREKQLQGLQHALRPAVRGARPLNVLAHGPPGTGKTTAIRHLFSELEEKQGVVPVRINCQMDTTRYSVFSSIFDAVLNYQPPTSGVSFSTIFEQITSQLTKNEAVLAVALDDINYLCYENEASDTLYSLLRSHETHSGAKIGVTAISSDMELDIVSCLDRRVQSVFRPETVFFPAYDTLEAREILEDRIRAGFYKEVVPSEVLDRVAGMTSDTGDLRVGIDLLRRAGLEAESEARTTITIQDVELAHEKTMTQHLSRQLNGLSELERKLVEVIAELDGSRSGDVFEAFEEETGLQYTRFSDLVNKLDRSGIIEAAYGDSTQKGRSRRLTTEYSSELVDENDE